MAAVLKLDVDAPRHGSGDPRGTFWRTWVTPIRWRLLGFALLALLAYGVFSGMKPIGAAVAMIGRSPCGCMGE